MSISLIINRGHKSPPSSGSHPMVQKCATIFLKKRHVCLFLSSSSSSSSGVRGSKIAMKIASPPESPTLIFLVKSAPLQFLHPTQFLAFRQKSGNHNKLITPTATRPQFISASQRSSESMDLEVQSGSPLSLRHEVWKDQAFFKWRKRDPHVPLHCHDTIEAAVYYEDMYVNFKLSMETASQIAGIRLLVTNEYMQSGLRDSGCQVFDHLMGMLNGKKPLF